jgi:hypothetical protein
MSAMLSILLKKSVLGSPTLLAQSSAHNIADPKTDFFNRVLSVAAFQAASIPTISGLDVRIMFLYCSNHVL